MDLPDPYKPVVLLQQSSWSTLPSESGNGQNVTFQYRSDQAFLSPLLHSMEGISCPIRDDLRLARHASTLPAIMSFWPSKLTKSFPADTDSSESANVSGAGAFRLQHNTLLDLRGNEIDWSNRRIASKIRLLLTNNWVVKWSNNPPTSVIPAQLYARYVESRIERSRFS